MIYIDFNGRCGDQFFQYAFARKIQIKINDIECLQFNFYNEERWRKKTNDNSFRNDLEYFNVKKNNCFVSEKNNLEAFGTKKQKRLFKRYTFFVKLSKKTHFSFFARFFQNKLQKNGIYYDDEFFDFFCYPKKGVDVFLKGYFEDYRYYEDRKLKSNLVRELTPIVNTLDG